MLNKISHIDERVAEIMEISESSIHEIASVIAANCDVSRMEDISKNDILNTISTYIQRGVLASIREMDR